MKSFLTFLLVLSAIAPLSAAGKPTLYQCPMHPWIKSEQPDDKCTICGMALVARTEPAVSSSDDPNLVTLSPASASVVGVKTTPATRGSLIRTLRVTGFIEADHTNHRILAARVPGRIESLGVPYVGAEIAEGDPLATMFSPAMLTAQREFVERLKGGEAFSPSDQASARERLLDLGLTEREITILEHTLEPVAMVNVRAPVSGTIVARFVYEGQYVKATDKLFEIADFTSMWFVFDAHEPDLSWLQTGQEVSVSVPSQPERVYRVPIDFIDPNLNEMTRTARVRAILPNRDRALRHRQTGDARVTLTAPDVLIVPRSAVLQHGEEPIVFVTQSENGYLARRVKLGRIGDTHAEVLAGLHAGETVVSSGGLILDGQAQLVQAAITGDIDSHQHQPEPSTPASHSATDDSDLLAPLAFAAADAAHALAADDLAAYRQQLPTLLTRFHDYLTEASESPLAKYRDTLDSSADLRSARRAFEPFSSALADEVLRLHLHHRTALHVYECPMTPVLGTGRWLSRDRELRNPFFGSAMLECGDEVE